jgi:hypothetical protein
MVVCSHSLPRYTPTVALWPPHPDYAANDSRAGQYRRRSCPTNQRDLGAQLELDGFETATIADLPTKQAQIDMGMVQREPLDSCEEDWEIERRPLERHEQLKSCALDIAPCSASSAPDEI